MRSAHNSGSPRPVPRSRGLFNPDRPRAIDHYIDYFGGGGGAADRHGVELMRRIGKPKEVMINTLSGLTQTAGSSGGGFFATHPATGDRIDALRELR